MRSITRISVSIAGGIAFVGCVPDSPVSWSDVRYASSPAENRPARTETRAAEGFAPRGITVPDSGACARTVRVVRAGKSFFAAWWSVRADSTAALLSSRSDDGGPWTRAVPADAADNDRLGCDRPAPSIFADIGTGYVHVAYFAAPSSGAGVFASHSMDRDSSFHAPVAMVYGSRPSETSIAARGDRVAVAYSDPNSARPRIFVALSETMGHTFYARIPVSEESVSATAPVVQLHGTKIEVSWTETSSPSGGRRASRTGIWK